MTYHWTYDTRVFTRVGGTDSASLLLKIKPGFDPAGVVGRVSVEVTDDYGCSTVEECYYERGVLNCSTEPCFSPRDLTVTQIN